MSKQKIIIRIKRALYAWIVSMGDFKKSITIWWYNRFLKKQICTNIRNKGAVTIMFPVINVGMWKSTKLFKLLLEDKRFSPYIVTSFVKGDTPEYMEYVQKSIVDYFEHLGFPVICTYNPNNRTYVKLSALQGDLFFLPQPYINKYNDLPKKSLFAYIPYDYPIQDDKRFHNWLYHNICWRIFAVNNNYKQLEEKYSISRGENVQVVGYSNADYYFDNHPVKTSAWKIEDKKLKRIIWAPHHSILTSDILGQSLFLTLAESFLMLTKQYRESCQFVFKPHPRLKEKLYQLDTWGKSKTDNYYDMWKNGENTNFVEGDYVDLFLSSDAMIHDCSSFIAEYLYSGNPVMFTLKDGHDYNLHGDDKDIFNAQYKGYNILDIEHFIDNVVKCIDPKKEERISVVSNELMYSSHEPVAYKIFNEIVSLIE